MSSSPDSPPTSPIRSKSDQDSDLFSPAYKSMPFGYRLEEIFPTARTPLQTSPPSIKAERLAKKKLAKNRMMDAALDKSKTILEAHKRYRMSIKKEKKLKEKLANKRALIARSERRLQYLQRQLELQMNNNICTCDAEDADEVFDDDADDVDDAEDAEDAEEVFDYDAEDVEEVFDYDAYDTEEASDSDIQLPVQPPKLIRTKKMQVKSAPSRRSQRLSSKKDVNYKY